MTRVTSQSLRGSNTRPIAQQWKWLFRQSCPHLLRLPERRSAQPKLHDRRRAFGEARRMSSVSLACQIRPDAAALTSSPHRGQSRRRWPGWKRRYARRRMNHPYISIGLLNSGRSSTSPLGRYPPFNLLKRPPASAQIHPLRRANYRTARCESVWPFFISMGTFFTTSFARSNRQAAVRIHALSSRSQEHGYKTNRFA